MASETIRKPTEIYATVIDTETDGTNGRTITIVDDHITVHSIIFLQQVYRSGQALGHSFIRSSVYTGRAIYYVMKSNGTWPDVNTPVAVTALIVN